MLHINNKSLIFYLQNFQIISGIVFHELASFPLFGWLEKISVLQGFTLFWKVYDDSNVGHVKTFQTLETKKVEKMPCVSGI